MDNKDYGFGGWGIVILIALFFLLFAGRGFGGSGEKGARGGQRIKQGFVHVASPEIVYQ